MEDRDTHLWHSAAYHRFFEGYQETETVDEHGRRRLRRVYMGSVWRQAVTPKMYILIRVAYAVLFALAVAALVTAGIRETGATPFYEVVTELATVCLLAWTGYVLLVNYLFIPKEMTVHDYRASHGSLCKASLFLTAAFAADVLTALLGALLAGTDPLRALLFLAGALCGGAMAWYERRVPYEEKNGKDADESAGIVIENDEP